MNDDGSGEDLPIIDVRSPAERLTDSGRDGIARLRVLLRESGPIDVAALIWMVCVIGVLGVQIYSVLDSSFTDEFGQDDGWFTAMLLASTGGYGLTLGCIAGIGLAVWVDSVRSRVALVLAAIGGAWAVVAGLIGVAVIFHEDSGGVFSPSSYSDNRAAAAVGQLLQSGFGIVVALVATSVLTVRRAPADPGPEIADLD